MNFNYREYRIMKKLFLTFTFAIVAGLAMSVIPQDAQAWWDDDDDWYDRPWYGGGPWYGGYRPYGYGYPYGGYGYPYGGGYYGGGYPYYGYDYQQPGTAEQAAPAETTTQQPAYPAYPAYPY